jgi:hypothetical protein
LMKLGRGVVALVKAEAEKESIERSMVLIMDCGCMMNQESVEVDIREEDDLEGFESYFTKGGVRFVVSPKVRHLADMGRLVVATYGGGRFRRVEFSRGKDQPARVGPP